MRNYELPQFKFTLRPKAPDPNSDTEKGMGCFISGQYQSGGNIGGMLGYVMTRTISDAITSINHQLADHHDGLRLLKPFELQQSVIMPDEQDVKQTTHSLDDGDFEIVHLFVSAQSDRREWEPGLGRERPLRFDGCGARLRTWRHP